MRFSVFYDTTQCCTLWSITHPISSVSPGENFIQILLQAKCIKWAGYRISNCPLGRFNTRESRSKGSWHHYKWTQGGRRWQQEKKATFSSNVSMLNICWNTEDMLSSFAVNCIQTVSPLEYLFAFCNTNRRQNSETLNVEIFEHAALGRGGREMLTGHRCCTSLAVCHFIWPI